MKGYWGSKKQSRINQFKTSGKNMSDKGTKFLANIRVDKERMEEILSQYADDILENLLTEDEAANLFSNRVKEFISIDVIKPIESGTELVPHTLLLSDDEIALFSAFADLVSDSTDNVIKNCALVGVEKMMSCGESASRKPNMFNPFTFFKN